MQHSLRRIQRRTFLAALGVGVTAPLAFKLSRWAVARPAPRPVRLFMMFLPHGQPMEHYDPVDGSGNLVLDAKGVGVLKPLEPFKAHVNVVRGMGMADKAFNHGAIRAAFTGRNDGGGGGEVSLPTVDSIDYVIAQKLGVPANALAVVPHDGNRTHWSNLFSHGLSWAEGYRDPVEAADKLFASIDDGGGVDEKAFRKEAIELSERQVERLRKDVAGLTREETKLSKHLAALQTLKASDDGTGVSGCTTRPALPAVEAVRGIDSLSQPDFTKLFHAQLEVAANAMVCGTSLVTSLQVLWVNSDIRMDFAGGPGVPNSYHMDLSHGAGTFRETFARIQQWFYQQLADKLLTVLNQPDPADAGRTVLDNSLVYVCTEISDGANHNSDAGETWIAGMQPMYTYLPQVLIGGAGGYLKTGGTVIQVEDNRPHADALATLADAMGAPVSEVGGLPAAVVEELKA